MLAGWREDMVSHIVPMVQKIANGLNVLVEGVPKG